MATPPKKLTGVQQARRLLQQVGDTPVQTLSGMSTYLDTCARALDAWYQSSIGLGAAPLRRHTALLKNSLTFQHQIQAWYKERNAEEYHKPLFKQFGAVTTLLESLKPGREISDESPLVYRLRVGVVFLSYHLEDTSLWLKHGTLQPLYYGASDDGLAPPVYMWKYNSPTWPMNPFSVLSRKNEYSNRIHGQWCADPRMRFVPSRQNVATFRRWDREFDPYFPTWRKWELILIQKCGLRASQCEELALPQILAQLDYTPIENELFGATAFLQQLAARTQRLEEFQTDEVKRTRYGELMAAELSDLLLKVHHLNRNELLEIAQFYPGTMKFEVFCDLLIDRLVSEHEGPYCEQVQRLLAAVASVLIPWSGDSAKEAKRALEDKLLNPDAKPSTADRAIAAIRDAAGDWINASAIGNQIGKTGGAVRSALSRAQAIHKFPIESCQTGEKLGYRWVKK